MANESPDLRNNPGDIRSWPVLQVDYPTDPARVAALLPPGLEPGAEPIVHVGFYNAPVPDEPEYGVLLTVDANFQGRAGEYTIGYAIDQEAAIYRSKATWGQPKYPAVTEYYRLGDKVKASCCHQNYTFVEFEGKVTGAAPLPNSERVRTEWWIKVSRSVTAAAGAQGEYDFPPHVVEVNTTSAPVAREIVEGELILRDSPWDPISDLLPQKGDAVARLVTDRITNREIKTAGPLDGDAFWPFVDTIGSSRWPGVLGGPPREVDYSAYLT